MKQKKTRELELPTREQLEAALKKDRYKRDYKRVLKSTVFTLAAVVLISVLIAKFVFPVLRITGDSMNDTLRSGDIVVTLMGRSYSQGDVIAFYYNNNTLVKRVIATSGQWVNIDEDGTVYVDDVPLDESYVTKKAFGECNIELPYQVPQGRYFVMGDNRPTSIDSRNASLGCVSDEMVIGKVVLRVWPFDLFGKIK